MPSADITVLGGLPVTVEWTVGVAEPDVGIMSDYVDEWHITYIANRRCKRSPDWLYKRILATKGEEQRIAELLPTIYEEPDFYEHE